RPPRIHRVLSILPRDLFRQAVGLRAGPARPPVRPDRPGPARPMVIFISRGRNRRPSLVIALIGVSVQLRYRRGAVTPAARRMTKGYGQMSITVRRALRTALASCLGVVLAA